MHFLVIVFNDIHELKYGQAEEKLEAGGDEKLILNFIWPYDVNFLPPSPPLLASQHFSIDSILKL